MPEQGLKPSIDILAANKSLQSRQIEERLESELLRILKETIS
jgi:hypothetical protein